MKKIAILLVFVLCAVMLGGCMSTGTGNTVADAVAFVKFSGVEEINLTLDKDSKVLVVTYGKDKTKADTVYKDSEIVGKTLEEALGEIVKANADFTELLVKVEKASDNTESESNIIKETYLTAAIKEVFKTNNDVTVKINDALFEIKDAETPNEGGEETSSEVQ